MTNKRPFHDFTERLAQFADGRRGIRNPFVIVPVQPEVTSDALPSGSPSGRRTRIVPRSSRMTEPSKSSDLTRLFVETDVFELAVDLGENSQPATITETMQDRLAEELVAIMVEKSTHQPSSDTRRSPHASRESLPVHACVGTAR